MKTALNTVNKVLGRICGHGRGWLFSPKDFLDLGNRNAVDKILSRLVKKGIIRRLAWGIYDFPKKNMYLGYLSPDPRKIAQVIANQNNIQLQPSGAYSANLLGISEQVPATITFLTDGANKKCTVGNISIYFKHVAPSSLVGAGTIVGIVIQALKYMGKDNIDMEMINRIKRKLSDKDKAHLIKALPKTPTWMHSIIKQIPSK